MVVSAKAANWHVTAVQSANRALGLSTGMLAHLSANTS